MKALTALFAVILVIGFSEFAHASCDRDSIMGKWKGQQVARPPIFGVADATYDFQEKNGTIGGGASYTRADGVSSQGVIHDFKFEGETTATFKVRLSDGREVTYTLTCSDSLLTGVGNGQTSSGSPIVIDVTLKKEGGGKR